MKLWDKGPALSLLLSAASALVLWACGGSATSSMVGAKLPERACGGRAEGGVIKPQTSTDSIAGNLAFYQARANYRSTARDLRARNRINLDRSFEIKTLVLVGTGPRIEAKVPKAQMPWLSLAYDLDKPPVSEIAFLPCDRSKDPQERKQECEWMPDDACRSGITQFNGALVLNFGKAPRNGRCARLWVTAGDAEPESLYLYSRERDCT